MKSITWVYGILFLIQITISQFNNVKTQEINQIMKWNVYVSVKENDYLHYLQFETPFSDDNKQDLFNIQISFCSECGYWTFLYRFHSILLFKFLILIEGRIFPQFMI